MVVAQPAAQAITVRRARALPLLFLVAASCKPPKRDDAPPIDDWKAHYHEPTVLADDQPGPSGIAVDATHVYWTHFGKPLVRRMPRAGGPVETLFEGTGELGGMWITIVGDTIYFSEAFSIQKLAKTGGTPSEVGRVAQLPARFTADVDGVYSVSGSVMQHAPVERRIAGGGELWDVAFDATHLYWLDRGGVWRAPKSGGDPQRLARGLFRFGKLAVSDTDVYWGDAVLQSIFAVPKAGGTPRFIAHAWDIATRTLAIDKDRLVVMQSGGNLIAIDLTTRERSSLALALQRGGSADHYYDVAVTPDAIFVAAGGQSLVGAGPVHIDLTKGNPQLPDFRYGGAILKLPPGLPGKPQRYPAGDLSVAWVYFKGATTEFQDRNNATRWIEDFAEAYPEIVDGRLTIRIIVSADKLALDVARARGELVESLVAGKLGPKAKIVISSEPASWQGDVRIGFDETELMRYFAAP